jgi:hypothetical protein
MDLELRDKVALVTGSTAGIELVSDHQNPTNSPS